ncbi:MAG: glycosyltransferase family 4 protein [Phycisphaerales bacterium]|nr:MAG: glycosyltransferase family 4 protein [Phycisphaerales bacterium]
MHIAMVTVFPKEPHSIDGGVAGVAKYLADELCQHAGVKLTVVAPRGDNGETTCEGWEAFNVYRLGRKGFWSFLPATLYDVFVGKRQISSLLRELKPDLVHFQGLTFLAAGCRQPSILTMHGIAERDAIWDHRWGVFRWPKRLLMKMTEGYGRCRAGHVTLISDYVRKFLPAGNRIRKSWLIENPVADSFFDIERQSEPGRIFCCCRVRPLKNVLGMIKAFTLIAEDFPDAQLRIAGAAEIAYLEKCKRQAETDGVQDKVHFLGNLSIEQVQCELSKANCLVVPSFQENAPLNIAEAMAAGVPLVAANVGGIPGMVMDGKTGLLVDPNDTGGISEAVSKMISDQKLAESMGRWAKQSAAERFRASAICEKTLQAYREVLAES